MAMISEQKIDEIRASSNIVDIIGEYVDLKRAGSSYKGLCPFHNEKTPSFTVDEKKQLFHCFGCGVGGDVVSFIMQKEGLSYPESLEYLANKAGIRMEYTDNYIANPKNKELYEINKDIMMFFYKNLLTSKQAINYLKNRGLSGRIVNRFMLGFAKNSWNDLCDYIEFRGYNKEDLENIGLIKKSSKGNYYDKYRNRIIFPIINHYGNVIGFGGRAIGEEMPKYLNSPESDIFKKRYNLYGLNIYKKQKGTDIILVEGYMDVIALNHHGVDYAVASLGTALTADQAKLIKRYAENVYICYDSDSAGINATDKAIEIFLEADIKPKIIKLEDGLDPDDFIKEYGKDAFLAKKSDALDVYNYKYNKILDLYSKASPNEKYEKLDLFVDFLASIDSDLTREIFTNNVSTLFKIDKSTLNQAVDKYNTNITKKENTKKYFNDKNISNIIVKSNPQKFNFHELEVLRLIFNQKEDYLKNKKIFDSSLSDSKILDMKEFVLNKDIDKFNQNDEDYIYILNYIRDNTYPVYPSELIEKIEHFERIKKRDKLKSLKKETKGSLNE
ncbi:DNA primase [Anaerococcus sp. mt242]|uniref:DNA primase n=1 Tax=Anaerococcus sp. mt242 TaxID=2661917 RepID=UPI001933D25C|nr:DNA primase [Anaerococcus sp. mt242]MBM0045864.1 DNA primase [Anaerococcus sp. mt242]